MMDGTHIDATVLRAQWAWFRGRKDRPTQNVLDAVTSNKQFYYVMVGWEGSTHDFAMLKSTLALPQPKGLRLLKGNINN